MEEADYIRLQEELNRIEATKKHCAKIARRSYRKWILKSLFSFFADFFRVKK